MDRVHFITHRGKRILIIDHTNSTSEEMQTTLDEVERVVGEAPPNSMLILSDFTAAHLDRAAADRMKVVATKDRPHVRRSAFVGADDVPEIFLSNLETFSVRHFPRFKSREEALEWLAADSEAAAS